MVCSNKTRDVGYWINPNSREIHRDHFHCFQFVGRLLAKCLLERTANERLCDLALSLLKHLLGVPISFSDLEYLDAEFHRHTLWLRDNEGSEVLVRAQRRVADGTVVIEELKPGGKDTLVMDANKEEYLRLLLKHRMFGFQQANPLKCHTVQWFWDAVRAFSQEERARLLQFATGVSRVPAEDFRVLLTNGGCIRHFGLQMVFINASPIGVYPKAHICFNRLDLPVYRSYEELATYLTLVINMDVTGFTMQ
ncbi:unnamed protein product [Peronospora destructor]|uniref:HECT-type E3 ubiquitin transferase n=1 Tax=Peronospora destructor TaxID=86335 RepID=A0AAV0T7E1_9STRA|nr:unnamed protein product [Peronospora destructor]